MTGGGYDQSELSSSSERKYTAEDLKIMQAWELDRKIQVSMTRILEWYKSWDNKCYVSFSGGKDSTVLADLAARVCKALECKLVLWFSDTGLEYPEIRRHVKSFGSWLQDKYGIEVETVMDAPRIARGKDKGKRIRFKDVIEKYGYPIISKEVSQKIYEARRKPDGACARRFDPKDEYATKYNGRYSMVKWNWLRDSNIPISHLCCNIMKKRPSKQFEKKTGMKPIIGTMTEESAGRKTAWLIHGCNAYNGTRPSSQPLSFWKEQDILKYLTDRQIPYASVYGEILYDEKKQKYYTTGVNRTGCMFCGFGCHLEKEPNRFQMLKQTHPKVWEYCMRDVEAGGLGMRKVLEFIGVKVE